MFPNGSCSPFRGNNECVPIRLFVIIRFHSLINITGGMPNAAADILPVIARRKLEAQAQRGGGAWHVGHGEEVSFVQLSLCNHLF